MSTKPLAIVILAAGKGTRMQVPGSQTLPKVMHPLAGRPMISWLLDTAEALNPERVIVVIGPEMQNLAAEVRPHSTVIQSERNGTAGAVKCALPLLEGFEGNVLVLLGDTPLVRLQTLQAFLHQHAGLSVLGVALGDPCGYGRIVRGHHGVQIVEEKDASAQERAICEVNTGVFCIDGKRIKGWIEKVDNKNAQGEYYITDLPKIAQREGTGTHVHITQDTCEVRGCNTLADLAALEQTLQDRLRKQAMEGGVRMLDPATVYLWHDTKIAPGAVIEPSVFFGPGVVVESGVQIKAFSHIEGAHIRSGASVGPFARIRPGSEIGAGARIGNFVEVKKSQIGEGSKINHLAYVGDCTMGADVNFSCGAITVNYDGFDKHQTVIGDGAMIGSNVSLVAPVTVGQGAFIAAGSTITSAVPEDALAIERSEARTLAGWAAKNRGMKAARKK
jgi:bifunctional UDP-N-acetylglucosamine pyrophosphorylase/glucosamine-1-phosphate N-acetyltransferase